MASKSRAAAAMALISGFALWLATATVGGAEEPEVSMADHFLVLAMESDAERVDASLAAVEQAWSPSLVPMAIEAALYAATNTARVHLSRLLVRESGNLPERDVNDLYSWLWNQDIEAAPDYANFKARLYRRIDDRFERYFLDRQDSARIRLDEIRWGGVKQDGIPPLREPKMIQAAEAEYLDDDNIVFGITINGDARAYPKRILAWHEMFTDTIGGVPIAGVYCTLCGTVIPYHTRVDGVDYRLGTSGFLYRSNKLMYDQATQSLWSTEKGEPVLGPLVDKGISLPF